MIISLIFKKYPCSCLNWPTLSYPAKDSHLPVVKTAQKGGPNYNLGGPFYNSIRYIQSVLDYLFKITEVVHATDFL